MCHRGRGLVVALLKVLDGITDGHRALLQTLVLDGCRGAGGVTDVPDPFWCCQVWVWRGVVVLHPILQQEGRWWGQVLQGADRRAGLAVCALQRTAGAAALTRTSTSPAVDVPVNTTAAAEGAAGRVEVSGRVVEADAR